jgi:hypothetical protein
MRLRRNAAVETCQQQCCGGACASTFISALRISQRCSHGSARVNEFPLEQEHGKLIWSFDIARDGSKNITEVQVDAKTGKIVSTRIETPDKQRREAIAEKKESKAY